MIEWVQKGDDWETTIGYTRVQLWRHILGSKMSKSWRLSLYNITDNQEMNKTHTLRTRNIGTAKKRACKKLIEILTDQRDTIDAWLKQLKD